MIARKTGRPKSLPKVDGPSARAKIDPPAEAEKKTAGTEPAVSLGQVLTSDYDGFGSVGIRRCQGS
jgi:hypothetical protein